MLVTAASIDNVGYEWKLPDVLKEREITPYRLRQTMIKNGVSVTEKTIYRWAKELPETVSVPHLMGVIAALRELTGEDVSVEDLLEYTPNEK